jgi:hypothetical protein
MIEAARPFVGVKKTNSLAGSYLAGPIASGDAFLAAERYGWTPFLDES